MRADIVVVGGGVVGASIAYHLSLLRPGRILLCEQARPPGAGATSRSGGLIRVHHSCPEDAALAAASHDTFARWPEAIGGDCGFRRTGFLLLVGAAHVEALRANVGEVSRLGVPASVLDPDDVSRLQPGWRLDGVAAAAYEPGSGFAQPRMATLALVARARAAGVEMLQGVTALRVVAGAGRVDGLVTSAGTVATRQVVLAAGAWTAGLYRPLGLDVRIACRQIAVAHMDTGGSAAACRVACIDDVLGTYFRPGEGAGEMLVGVDTGREEVCPDDETPPLGPGRLAAARATVARRIPELDAAPVVCVRSAFDGYTPDGHALVGALPEVEGVYVSTGFSGGGFKVAPAVGRAVAREVVDGVEQPLLAPYRPDRFRTGRTISAPHPYTHL